MLPALPIAILAATFITATISAIFGMAGGLILMGVLAWYLPIATAMVLHGSIQLISNGSRAIMLFPHIAWKIIAQYFIGVAIAFTALLAITLQINQPIMFLILGMTPLLVWLPKEKLHLDITKPVHAAACGFLVQLLNTIAGVAGPLLDLFFVKNTMSRQTVVATKATTQVIAHTVKIAFWITTALAIHNQPNEFLGLPYWALALLAPLSIAGTWTGGQVLNRMTDASFREWTKWIVTIVGVVYIIRGLIGLEVI